MTLIRIIIGSVFLLLTSAWAFASPDLAGGLRTAPPQPVQPLPAERPGTVQPLTAPTTQPSFTAPPTPVQAQPVFPTSSLPSNPAVQSGISSSSVSASSAKPLPASQDFITHATTPIGAIHFRGGRLVQNPQQFGRWLEMRRDGSVNYEFFETASGPDMIELTGPQGQVRLFVDLKDNVVRAQWPGQTLKTIYTITKVEPLSVTSPPIIPQPSVVTPPVVNPQPLLPQDLVSATYKTGQFIKVDDRVWQQTEVSGPIFLYEQLGYDENSVYLFNASTRTFVTLSPASKQSRIATAGAYLSASHPLTSISGAALTPIPPQTNGTLSPSEHQACLQTGGTVERAGLLGAERCTRRFADSGQVCTDSSQCLGQCRVSLDVSSGTPTTGLCQASDNPFGCFAEVENGVASAGLCVD